MIVSVCIRDVKHIINILLNIKTYYYLIILIESKTFDKGAQKKVPSSRWPLKCLNGEEILREFFQDYEFFREAYIYRFRDFHRESYFLRFHKSF